MVPAAAGDEAVRDTLDSDDEGELLVEDARAAPPAAAADDVEAAAETWDAHADEPAEGDTVADAAPATEKRYVAVALPRVPTIDDVWRHELEEMMGSGKERITFRNRRGTGGDMHYATIEYADAATARTVAAMPRPPSYGGATITTAVVAGPADPTEVEVFNLNLDPSLALQQFSSLGTVVAHRIATRKMKAEFVFATRQQAQKACAYDGKVFRERAVSVRIRETDDAPAPLTSSTTPAAPVATATHNHRLSVVAKPVKVGKREGRKVKRTTNGMRQLVFSMMPDDVKEKVLKHRKTKETVMQNLKMVKGELGKQETLAEDKKDPKRLAVLHGEQERLKTKQKKLNAALKKLCRPLARQAKAFSQ